MTTIPLTHQAWQQQVVDLAHHLGWAHVHVRKSIGKGRTWTTATNLTGWVDLLLWHPSKGGVIGVELKVGKDKARPEQIAVMASLEGAGVRCFVWYPDDFDEAVRVLSNPPGRCP